MNGLKGGIVNQHVRLRLVLFLLLALVICTLGLAWAMSAGASSASSASPAASPASSAAGSASTAGKVVYKVGWTRQPDNLSPFIGFEAPAFEMWYLTYDSLVGYDPKTLAPMKGENSTGLATDWSVSSDGLTWTFKIRHNAKWSDGVPLTAKDVAFTYNYIVDNPDYTSNLTAYSNLITKATALDDYTVQFVCSKPKPDMTRHWIPILPEHIWSKIPAKSLKGYQNNPPYVGSGPYTCVEWKKNNYVHLTANPTWWGPKPAITDLYFTYYTNGDTMLQDIKSGTIDAAMNLVPTQIKQLQSDPDVKARAVATDAFDELAFNCYTGPSLGNPVLRDVKFRQALNYAVDKQKLVDIVMMGYTTAGTTIIPPNYYHDPDWHWEPPANEKYTFDLAKARQLLDAAGYKDTDGDGIREDKQGKPIVLGLITRDESTGEQQEGKFIAGWFKDIGIKVKLSVMDSSTLSSTILNEDKGVLKPDYDMFLWGWYLDYDPGSMLSYFTKSQIGNWSDCYWTDPEYEKLFKQQSVELDANKRKALIDRMQQILYEQSPYIVTDYQPDFEAFNTAKWQGYIQIPSPNGNTIVPPFGNGGYANFLTIQPKTAAESTSGGGGTGTYVAIGVAVVVIVLIVVLLVLRRRPRETEEV